MKSVLIHLTLILIYCFIACVFLFPLPLHFSNGLLAAESGDPLLQIWVTQWNIHKLSTLSTLFRTGFLTDYFEANIFYPYHKTFAYHDHLFGLGLIGFPIYAITRNPILTYNVLLLLSFVLSAYGLFLLCREITQHYPAAFLGGLIFGFLPYRFAHLDHLNLLSIYWLPFCFCFLTRYFFPNSNTTNTRVITPILFWFCFLLQPLTSFNYLFFSTIAVGIYGSILFIWQWKSGVLVQQGHVTRDMALFILGGCVVGLLLLPFVLPYLKVNQEMGFERTIQETLSLSARLQDYLVAPEQSLLYGKMTRQWETSSSPYPKEQILFNGFLPMVLAFLGMFGIRKKMAHPPSLQVYCVAYGVLLSIALILSFGPYTTIFGKSIPLPYSWFYSYLPGFKSMRVPARFGLLVSFALAVLAAIGVSQIQRGGKIFRKFRVSLLFPIILGGIILLEYYTPAHDLRMYPGTLSTIPAVYQWLAEQPKELRIIELPVRTPKDDFESMYYSTFHWKRILNGRSAFIPTGITQIFKEMQTFPSRRAIELLKSLCIDYVIFHGDRPSNSIPPKPEWQPAHTFDNVLVIPISSQAGQWEDRFTHVTLQYRLPSSLQQNESYALGITLAANRQRAFSPLPQEKATLEMEWRLLDNTINGKEQEIVYRQQVESLMLPYFLAQGEESFLPFSMITPAQPGAYDVVLRWKNIAFEPQAVSRHVTLLPQLIDSRKPGKLQAEFLYGDIPDTWKAGTVLPVRLLVKNNGDTLWKSWIADRKLPLGEVRLGVFDWIDAASGASLIQEQEMDLGARGRFNYDVAPGEEIMISTNIPTPDIPGEYLIEFDLVSEHILWFSQQGSPTFKKRIHLKQTQ